MNSDAEHQAKPLSAWKQVFAMDLRSLALMRITLGCLILVDLAMRCSTMQAMYTDAGFFSVDVRSEHVQALEGTRDAISWSLHARDGSMNWQISLFILAAIAAVLMIAGWKTRLVTIVSWVLLTSLQMRNPLILHSGDCLFRLALFWGMFLPMGSVWSMDARKKTNGQRNYIGPWFSGASVGLLLSLCSMYFFAGISKCNEVWFSGEAMEYVLKLDIYATSLGQFMLGYPVVLKLLTWATLVAELSLPVLILVPWQNKRWRYLAIVVFAALHLGIAATMSIGLFSWVSLSVWGSLIPGSFWDRKVKDQPNSARDGIQPVGLSGIMASGFCFAMAAYFMLWNIASVRHPSTKDLMPQQARVVGKWLNMRQDFRMFDVPPKHSPWFVYHAKLKNGKEVDIFRNTEVDFDRPDSVLATIPQHHWRRMHRNLARPGYAKYRVPVSEYFVRRWNETHDKHQQIEVARTIAHLEEIAIGEPNSGEVTQVWFQFGDEIAQKQMFNDLLRKVKEKGIILP